MFLCVHCRRSCWSFFSVKLLLPTLFPIYLDSPILIYQSPAILCLIDTEFTCEIIQMRKLFIYLLAVVVVAVLAVRALMKIISNIIKFTAIFFLLLFCLFFTSKCILPFMDIALPQGNALYAFHPQFICEVRFVCVDFRFVCMF
jgi:hypothetical protein